MQAAAGCSGDGASSLPAGRRWLAATAAEAGLRASPCVRDETMMSAAVFMSRGAREHMARFRDSHLAFAAPHPMSRPGRPAEEEALAA